MPELCLATPALSALGYLWARAACKREAKI